MRKPAKKEEEFWLINKSFKKDVSVGDLRITIRKGQRINLLSNHYNFTPEQLEKSAQDGSIYKKSNVLAVARVEPTQTKPAMVKEVVKPRILKPLRNPKQNTGVEKFEELDFEDDFMGMTPEQFAAEQADAERLAHAPAALSVDPTLLKEEEDGE